MREILEHRSLRYLLVGGGLILVLLVGLLVVNPFALAGLRIANPFSYNALDVPAYPKSVPADLPQHPRGYLVKRQVLETADSPAMVQTYYHNLLVADGWDDSNSANQLPDPHYRYYEWNPVHGQFTFLTIIAEPLANGDTAVYLLFDQPPEM